MPKFHEEGSLGDIFTNTRSLWQTLWNEDIDVRAQIIRPALERVRLDYDSGDVSLKTRLGSLRLPKSE